MLINTKNGSWPHMGRPYWKRRSKEGEMKGKCEIMDCRWALCTADQERYGRRCFSGAGPALWNKLPTPVKECQSFPSFKAKLKTHLFRQAFRDIV